MYRRTARAEAQETHPADWQPPLVRRVVTIVDFDGPQPVERVITMRRTDRIDTYDVQFGDREPRRMGWSETLRLLRKALPRVSVRKVSI